MVAAGAAEARSLGVRPTVVSPLGVVPKPYSDKLHLVVNMRYANEHLVKRFFEFEGLSYIVDMVEKEDYTVSYDLVLGPYHVPLHPDLRRFVGLEWRGKYYQCYCLPYGLSTAPSVFSKFIRELVMHWRARGINILPYLDDLFFLLTGFVACRRMVRMVEEGMRLVGLSIN